MSKRSFHDFSTTTSNARYLSVLDHANSLLKAAKSLKRDLERLGEHGDSSSYEKITAALKQHNVAILPATQALAQDEMADVSDASEGKHKVRKLDKHQDTSKDSQQSGLPVPQLAFLTKWTLDDIPAANVLPPLPPVMDPVLEVASRTHSGVASGLGDMHYEKLEWIGDAYLYLVSSLFIYQTFPDLTTGRCSQLRERLIKNEALSEFTLQYGLEKKARLPHEFDIGRQTHGGGASTASNREKKKVLGDLMEAYAAAAILGDADGLSRVVAWLKPIWATVLRREISDEYKNPTIQKFTHAIPNEDYRDTNNSAQSTPKLLNPKVALSRIIGTKGVNITYRDEGKPTADANSGLPWYTVGAYYSGLGERDVKLGFGSGLSKKEAGANAASRALENKKLIKRLTKLKDEYLALLPKPQAPLEKTAAAP
ncbi:ribonuclease III [Xylaria sp. CBS 124048]|nr:ribonuclease III [Xylaria sp. CBS 124048]